MIKNDSAPDRMHIFDPAMTQMVLDYVRDRLSMDETPLDFPGDGERLRELLSGLMRPEGNDAPAVMELYSEHLSLAVISADSPRFFAFIPAAPTKASLLFDMVVSSASLQGISWLEAAGAVAAENQVLRLIANLAGLPDRAGGCFVAGGSAANLSALAVARDTARRTKNVGGGRLRVAVSDQVHSSIKHTLSILDMDVLVVSTEDHRLTGDSLERALVADAAEGNDPSTVIAVVATAGTTNAGIIDELSTIAPVAKTRDLWLHVDGAYGGAGLFAASVRDRYNGVECADSLILDPHKWLFAPFDCAALLYREPALARAVHTQEAGYLDAIHDHPTDWNPTDYAYHLTRRARGLPLWFSLAVNGTDAYRDAIERGLGLARLTADLIRRTPHLELLREPELSVVLFRRIDWTADDYHSWCQSMLDDQLAFVTPTTWEGETVGRLVFLHPQTTMEMVEDVLARTAP